LEEFAKFIQVNKGQAIHLQVYNTKSEQVRVSTLVPTDGWGGEGLIGADISFGYFNQLPLRKVDKK